jgi:hypothetical protein
MLRQVEAKFSDIKKGDIFSVVIEEEGKIPQQTEWAVAVEDSQMNPSDHREFFVPSDKVYLVIGKPEISSLNVVKSLDS